MDAFIKTPLFVILSGALFLGVLFVGQVAIFAGLAWLFDRAGRLWWALTK